MGNAILVELRRKVNTFSNDDSLVLVKTHWNNILGIPSTFNPASHNHDDRYYTETEADGRFLKLSGGSISGTLYLNNNVYWKPKRNFILEQTADNDEWSFDINRNGLTGGYWQVWDSSKQTLLKVEAESGKVTAPYTLYEGSQRVYSPNNKPSMATLGGKTSSEITTEIQAAIDALIGGAPGALDTLNELAAALDDDADFHTAVTNALALKANKDNPSFSGVLTINNDGVGKIVGGTDGNDYIEIDGASGDYIRHIIDGSEIYKATTSGVNIANGYLRKAGVDVVLANDSRLSNSRDTKSSQSPIKASELSSSKNLNDLKTAGFYYQSSNADTSGNNYPVNRAGSLLVQRSAGQCTQLYITYDTGDMYTRAYYQSWSSWLKVTKDSLAEMASDSTHRTVTDDEKISWNNKLTQSEAESLIGAYNTDIVTPALNNRVAKNSSITPGTKSKITFDAKGLVTGGSDLAITKTYIGSKNSANGTGSYYFSNISNYTMFFIEVYAEWTDGNASTSGVVFNNVGAQNLLIFDSINAATCYLKAGISGDYLTITDTGVMPWFMVSGASKLFTVTLYGISLN